MTIELRNPTELAQPRGFSHAVIATGTTVWLAGQTGLGADGRIVDGGIVAQFERALSNLLTALSAAGGQPQHLVTLTIYLVDMDDYLAHSRPIGEVWRRLIGTHYPAMAGVGVSRLWDRQALVEVQGVAVLPQ